MSDHPNSVRQFDPAGPTTGAGVGEPDGPPVPVPDHTLLRPIGQGAYGVVWLAQNALGQYRAVKIVHRRTFDSERPFEREFAGIQRFEPISRRHESQLNILHVGRGPNYFYYTMELADDQSSAIRRKEADANETGANEFVNSSSPAGEDRGETVLNPDTYSPRTLRSDLQFHGRLPVDECVRLGLALTTAVEHLHRHGLVHRDIKPSNIVFVHGIPKLADIGLVAQAERTMSFVGTEGYLPPEGPGTVQADLFSLGKVLYEIGTGHDRQQFPELPTRVAELPDRAALAEFNEVLVRACAPDVKQRYQTAAEMHADLALLQSGKSVSRLRTVERRLRFVARGGAIITALAAVIAAGWLWQARQTQDVQRLADEKSRIAVEKTTLANQLARMNDADRNRIVHLDIASGMRLLDEDDPAGALLWFADALPLLTNNPAEESIHRIRIQQTLNQTPRTLQVFPHESGLTVTTFSPDGRFIATATKDGNVRVWNAEDGTLRWGPKLLPGPVHFGRFTGDGKRLVLSSSALQGTFNGSSPPVTLFAVLDAQTGEEWKWPQGAFEGADAKLAGAYFSPDDRWLATAHLDSGIHLFDMESGRRTLELAGHTGAVHFISFSANGKLVASASEDRTVRLWRLPNGEPVGRPLPHRWPAVRVLFADDGSHAVTTAWENVGGDGGVEIYVWDTDSAERPPQVIEARDRVALFVAPGAEGLFFVQDRPPSFARAYYLGTGKEVLQEQRVKDIRSWDFTRDGSQVVLGLGDHVAQVFDTRRGSPLTKPFRHGGWGVNTVQFSPSGMKLLTGCEDGNARLWDLRPRPSETAHGSLPGSLSAGFTHRGRLEFARSGIEFPVHIWPKATAVFNDRLQLVQLFRPDKPGTDIFGPVRAPDGKSWAILVFDERFEAVELRLGIVKAGEIQQVRLPHPGILGDVTFTPDSRFVISACEDNRIRFWSTSDGSLARTVAVPEGGHGALSVISSDGRTALWEEAGQSHSPTYLVKFFDLDSGTFIGESRPIAASVFYEVFSPSGEYVALLDQQGPVTILESRTGRLISSRIRHPGTLDWVQWAPDGHRLLTAGDNDEVLVWDVAGDSRPLHALRTPGTTTRTARWSPDGRLIVAVGSDHRVRVWDAGTGGLVAPAFEHPGILSGAALMNSNRLITVSYTDKPLLTWNPLRAWDLTETELSAEVLGNYSKVLSGRRLSAAGSLLPLQPSELAELSHSLRTSHRELFEISAQELIQWHRGEVGPTRDLAQLNRSLDHLKHLAELLPNDPEINQLRSHYQARLVPPRAPGTTANLLDLSRFYTWSLDTTSSEEFARLPRGLQTLAGTPWDLRGVVTVEPGEAVTDIPVEQICTRLHFLLFVDRGQGQDGNEVAHWVIRYADHSMVEWPLIYGAQLRDWWWNYNLPREASQAVLAWEDHPNIPANGVRLFKATWTNPRPDAVIQSLDLVGGKVNVATAVVAITAE